MSKYCPKCGIPVSENAKYCRSCGNALRRSVKNESEKKIQVITDSEPAESESVITHSGIESADTNNARNKTEGVQANNSDYRQSTDTGVHSSVKTENGKIGMRFFAAAVVLLASGLSIVLLFKRIGRMTHEDTAVSEIADTSEYLDHSTDTDIDESSHEIATQESDMNENNKPLEKEEENSEKEEIRTVTFEQIRDEFQQQNWETYAALIFEYLKDNSVEKLLEFAEQSGRIADVCLQTINYEPADYGDNTTKITYYLLEIKDSFENTITLQFDNRYDFNSGSVFIRVTDKWNINELEMATSNYKTFREPIIEDGRLMGIRTYYVNSGVQQLVQEDIYEYLDYPCDGLYEDIDYIFSDSSYNRIYTVFDVNGRKLYCSNDLITGKYRYVQDGFPGEIYYYYDEYGNMIREKTYDTINETKLIRFNEYEYENGNCIREYNYDENWVLRDLISLEYNERGDLIRNTVNMNDYVEYDFAVLEYSYSYDEYGRITRKEYTERLDFDYSGEIIYTYY